MEKINPATRNPIVKGWCFVAKRREGDLSDTARANLAFAACSFGTFADDKTASRLEVGPYSIVLEGDVYGHSKFSNGDCITTSYIDHIDKILPVATAKMMDKLSLEDWQGIEPLYCAVTASGSKYHFLMENIDDVMLQLIETAKATLCT